jgi:predicted amidohydrolase YtcJ
VTPDAVAADVVLSGGPIVTMDARTEGATAVVVRDGRVLATGGAELTAAHPEAERVDLAGATLVPGFIDAHNHLSVAALHPCFGDATAVRSVEDLHAVLREHAAANPDAEFLRLHGWDENHWGFAVDREMLDAAVGDRPVVLAHYSLHQCVANTVALDRLGIGRSTPDPQAGEIGRGPDGLPNGMLVERAWSEAHARSLAAYAAEDRWAEHIAVRARQLLREGITAVHDAACSPEAEDVYGAMAAAGTLPVSVLALPHPAALLRNEPGGRLDGPPTGEGSASFRIGPMKLFADGGVSIALDTAIGGHPVRYGTLMDDLEACAVRATDRGFRLAVHAIGNVGVSRALDVFETVARRTPADDQRFRIEHAGITGPPDWRRAAALGAIGVVQPGFVEHVGRQSHGVRFDDHHWLAFAGLAEAGVILAGSSDDPCAPSAPLWCIDKGVRRTTSSGIAFEPEQSVPFTDWLHAYTMGAALAGGQEDERGSITPGKRADFVALDLADGSPRVAATWVAGARVWQRGDSRFAV